MRASWGALVETPIKTGLPGVTRVNRLDWCAVGLTDVAQVELVELLGENRASRETLKPSGGARVPPGRQSGRFLAHVGF